MTTMHRPVDPDNWTGVLPDKMPPRPAPPVKRTLPEQLRFLAREYSAIFDHERLPGPADTLRNDLARAAEVAGQLDAESARKDALIASLRADAAHRDRAQAGAVR